MPHTAAWRLLADLVLVVHVAVVLFVVGGLALVVVGNLRAWRWVNAPWFRAAHLGAIGFVVAESWLGIACPLTLLEAWLRTRAGGAAHGQGFVEHWLQTLLYHQAPGWVFGLAYTVFGLLVAAAWWRFPPTRRRRGGRGGGA